MFAFVNSLLRFFFFELDLLPGKHLKRVAFRTGNIKLALIALLIARFNLALVLNRRRAGDRFSERCAGYRRVIRGGGW